MIGHFLTPRIDELLFSICARFSGCMQYRNKGAVSIELFGRRNTAAVIDLPRNLGYLIAQLPNGHNLTADRLIDEHTLLSFYSPFHEIERVERMRQSMTDLRGDSIRQIAGLCNTNICPLNFLRFCPLCLEEEDKERFGEYYWHRSHQVPGINVCHTHHVFLENSNVSVRNMISLSSYISAERAELRGVPRYLNVLDPNQQALVDMAQDAFWLLGQHDLVLGYQTLHNAYVELMKDNGLATPMGSVKVPQLLSKLRDRYSSSLLKSFGCDFDERMPSNWPSRIVKDITTKKSHPTQRHLLIIRLLGYSAESFFKFCMSKRTNQARGIDNPFGNGPWPCLNPVCRNFGEYKIEICSISSRWWRGGNPIGTFTCECGFTYTRNGPDKSPKDLFRYDYIKAYGTVWVSALISMWTNPTFTIKQIGCRLGITFDTVKYQAANLKLQIPRFGPRKATVPSTSSRQECLRRKLPDRDVSAKLKWLKDCKKYRKQWLAELKRNPTATQKERKHTLPSVYYRLYKYDREWLLQNTPRFNRKGRLFWTGKGATML